MISKVSVRTVIFRTTCILAWLLLFLTQANVGAVLSLQEKSMEHKRFFFHSSKHFPPNFSYLMSFGPQTDSRSPGYLCIIQTQAPPKTPIGLEWGPGTCIL